MAGVDALVEAVCRSLEETAFVLTEAGTGEEPVAPELIRAELAFAGPEAGRLALVLPVGLAAEIAANLLGVDADDDAAVEGAADAAGEMLNMAAGAVMNLWFGDRHDAHIGVPAVRRCGPPELRALAARARGAGVVLADDAWRVDVLVLPP